MSRAIVALKMIELNQNGVMEFKESATIAEVIGHGSWVCITINMAILYVSQFGGVKMSCVVIDEVW